MTDQQHIEILDSLKSCLQQMQKLETKIEILEDIAQLQQEMSKELSNMITTVAKLQNTMPLRF